MKLSELVEFYGADGFVVASAGSGCADPQWVDYAEAMAIDAMIGEVEMRAASMADAAEYEQDYRLALDDVDGLCKFSYVSEWLVLDADDNGYKRWNGADKSAYRWRIIL